MKPWSAIFRGVGPLLVLLALPAPADLVAVKTLAGQVANLSAKVANGTITAAEQATLESAKAALAGQNNVLNDLGLLGAKGGGLEAGTYQVCQQAYVEQVVQIIKQKAAEHNANANVQIKIGSTFQPGTDLDILTDATSPEQVKAIQNSINEALHDYVKQGGEVPQQNFLQKLNIDIMVDPKNVTPEQFETIAGLNNDAYKTPGAAAHEAAIREGGPVNVAQAVDHANEMLNFGAKKNNLAANLLEELIKLEKNPDTKVPGTPAYELYKTLEATHIKAAHLEQKYINRFDADVKVIAQETGVSAPPGSKLPANGAIREGGAPGKAFAGNALSDALIQQQVQNMAEVLSGQGAKNPAAGQAFQQAACFAQNLPPGAKGQLMESVRAKYGDAAAKNLVEALKNLQPAPKSGLTPTGGGFFGDNSFKLTSTQLGVAGTALTAAGHTLLLLEAIKTAGTVYGQVETGNYLGAAGTAGGFTATTFGMLKVMNYAQSGLTAWAPSVAPYLPVVMAGLVSYGLTAQLLENITTADGQTLNQHIQSAFEDYWQYADQQDVKGTQVEADKQQMLIKLVKSGFYQPKEGMTMAEVWQALSSGKALKDVLKPTVAAQPPPPVNAADLKQAAWEQAVAAGLLKPDEYKKFEKGYHPATGKYAPPKEPAAKAFAGNNIIGTNDVFLGRGDGVAGHWTFGRPDGTMYSVDWNGNVEEHPFPASAPWWNHPGLRQILGDAWGKAPPGFSTNLRPVRDRQSGWAGLDAVEWLHGRLVRDGLAQPDGSDGPKLKGATAGGRAAQMNVSPSHTKAVAPSALPGEHPAATTPAATTALYEAQLQAVLAAMPDVPPARPRTTPTPPAPAVTRPVPVRPAAPPPPARVPVATPPPAVQNANVVGDWSRIDTTANFRETLALKAGGAGTHTISLLDAFIRSRVGDKSVPLTYSVKGNQVTINLPGGSATGTVSGNTLTVGNKTFRR